MNDLSTLNSLKVGKRIRQIRKAQKLSMKDLAQKVGISFSYIAKIETGQNRISVEMIDLLAKSLHISVDSLLCPDDVSEKKLKKRGWFTLRDFFIVRYDSLGRPEHAFYDFNNQEANVIGQLRKLKKKSPQIAEVIFQKFEEYAKNKDESIFQEWIAQASKEKKASITQKNK